MLLSFPDSFPGLFSPCQESLFFPPPPPKNYKISSAFSYNFKSALTRRYDFTSAQESNLFPEGKDVFCILNMPYLSTELQRFDFFKIAYVLEGNCTFLFESERIELSEGDVCIISPVSDFNLPLKPGCISVSITVRKSTFDSLFSNLLSKQDLVSLFFRNCLYEPHRTNYILLRTGNDKNILETVRLLVYECNMTDNYSNSCSISLLNVFLAQSLRAATDITLHRYEDRSEKNFNFAVMLQYIQQNYRTVTLSGLAETFHFGKSYLSTLIHKNMGRSFTEVLRTLRMNRAMELLMNTPMAVSEIATAVGYDSVDYFSRAFRQEYGVSPQQYKQRHKSSPQA